MSILAEQLAKLTDEQREAMRLQLAMSKPAGRCLMSKTTADARTVAKLRVIGRKSLTVAKHITVADVLSSLLDDEFAALKEALS